MIESADIIKNKNSIKFTIEKNGEYITFIKKFVSDEWYKELIIMSVMANIGADIPFPPHISCHCPTLEMCLVFNLLIGISKSTW